MMAKIESVRELEVYKMAFEAAMRIFHVTKTFPAEERFSLTDQIRRASRSVCTNLSEGWRKRHYKAVFVNKLSDSMQAPQSWGNASPPVVGGLGGRHAAQVGALRRHPSAGDLRQSVSSEYDAVRTGQSSYR